MFDRFLVEVWGSATASSGSTSVGVEVPGERVLSPPVPTTTPEPAGDVDPLGRVPGDAESDGAVSDAPGVPDGDDAPSAGDVDSAPAEGSADATQGHANTAVPIPNATASPPIRPTYAPGRERAGPSLPSIKALPRIVQPTPALIRRNAAVENPGETHITLAAGAPEAATLRFRPRLAALP